MICLPSSGAYASSGQPSGGYGSQQTAAQRSRGGVGGGWGSDTAPAPAPAPRAGGAFGGGGGGTGRPPARGGNTSGAKNDGTYEHGLIEGLCAPGGMRAQPPRDKLDEFMRQVGRYASLSLPASR